MNDPNARIRVVQFPPKTIGGWLAFVGLVVVGLFVAVLGLFVFLGVALVGLIAAPFMKRKFMRHAPPPHPPESAPDASPGSGRVIDADYEVR